MHIADLYFTNQGRASLFAWVLGKNGAISFHCGSGEKSGNQITARDGNGNEIRGRWGESMNLSAPGIWLVELEPTESGTPMTVQISIEGEVYPFIIPGPGLNPSHFPHPHPTLLFPAGKETEVWVDVPEEITTLHIGAWLGRLDPAERYGNIELPNGNTAIFDWKCMPIEELFYHMAEMEARGLDGWWKISLPAADRPSRLTVWEGLPIFLRKPEPRMPYGKLACTVTDNDGRSLDARFQVFYCGHLIAQRDALKGETAVIPVVPGEFQVQAGRGVEFDQESKAVAVDAGQKVMLSFRLQRVLTPQEGWVYGDHHMHSFYLDGVQSPEMMTRAAKANGLSYMFLTDADPQVLLDADLQSHNEDGVFMALPGTEIMFRSVHMNALNIRQHIRKQEEDVESCIHEVKNSGTDEHPVALLLNHPSHLAGVMSQQAYFRSWWVADTFDGIDLVENFDFATWFDKLNEGRKLPGLWTTDGHDIAFVPPGKKGTYVYIGSELTEASLMRGLIAGKSFNTRYPGALIYLTVNGAIIGETAVSDKGRFTVRVTCQSARPLERVELIADGRVVKEWHGNRSMRLEAEIQVTNAVKWVIARAYAFEEEEGWPADGHCMEPLLESGCIAFTNPVWIEQG